MFDDLELFLKGQASLRIDKEGQPTDRDIQVATAVLLVRMAGVDENFLQNDVQALLRTLEKQFDLSAQAAGELIEIAKFLERDKSKMRNLLEIINDRFQVRQKQTVLAMMWSVLRADGLPTRMEATFAAKVAKALKLTREQVQEAQQMVESGQI